MVAAAVAALLISIGSGVWYGRVSAELEQRQQEIGQNPDGWPPGSHTEMLKTCGNMCEKMQRYNSMTGKCECK